MRHLDHFEVGCFGEKLPDHPLIFARGKGAGRVEHVAPRSDSACPRLENPELTPGIALHRRGVETARIFDPLGEERLSRAGRVDQAEIKGERGETGKFFRRETLRPGICDAAAAEVVPQDSEPFRLDLIREEQPRF